MEFLARSVHCEVCFKFFKSDIQLKKHHRNIHDKRTCELCNKEISAGNFNRHKKEHHLVLDSRAFYIDSPEQALDSTPDP